MFKKMAVPIMILCIITASMILSGCEGDQGPEGAAGIQGPQGDPGPTELNIIAIMKISEDLKAYSMGSFAMSVYNAPSIPHVRLNNQDLVPDEMAMYEEGRLAYKEGIGLVGVDSAFIDISYTMMDGSAGIAASAISIPTEFLAIDNNVGIGFGEDIDIEWEMSDGADAYWVGFTCFLTYTDTAGAAHYNSLEFDTILAANDTTLQALTSTLFPDPLEVMQVDSFGGNCSICAVTGPWLPGEANNFTGDAFGVFVGVTDALRVNIELTFSKSGNVQAPEFQDSLDRLFEKRLRQLTF